jgi:hypothetical protein
VSGVITIIRGMVVPLFSGVFLPFSRVFLYSLMGVCRSVVLICISPLFIGRIMLFNRCDNLAALVPGIRGSRGCVCICVKTGVFSASGIEIVRCCICRWWCSTYINWSVGSHECPGRPYECEIRGFAGSVNS